MTAGEARPDLSPREVEQLVEIRLQLETALRLTLNAGRYHRAAAIVALDGVVERATAFVAVTLGITIPKNATLEDLFSRVREKLPTWHSRDWADIRELRRARNSAQHEGLPPDRDLVPRWREAVRSYVRSLLQAHFAVDVAQMHFADAIKDDEWRVAFRKAEELTRARLYPEVVVELRALLDRAAQRWKILTRVTRRPLGIRREERAISEYVISEVERRVQPDDWAFASTPAEAVWAREAMADGQYLDADEAERLLAFVFGWITSLESATSDWPESRFMREQVRKRLVADGTANAALGEVLSCETSHDRRSVMIQLALEGVPPEERFDFWVSEVSSKVEEHEAMEPSGQVPGWQFRLDGTVSRAFDLAELSAVQPAMEALAAGLAAVPTDVVESIPAHDLRSDPSVSLSTARLDELGVALPMWVTGGHMQTRGVLLYLSPDVHLIHGADVLPAPGIIGIADVLRSVEPVGQARAVMGRDAWLVVEPLLDTVTLESVLAQANEVVGPALEAALMEEKTAREAVCEVRALVEAHKRPNS